MITRKRVKSKGFLAFLAQVGRSEPRWGRPARRATPGRDKGSDQRSANGWASGKRKQKGRETRGLG